MKEIGWKKLWGWYLGIGQILAFPAAFSYFSAFFLVPGIMYAKTGSLWQVFLGSATYMILGILTVILKMIAWPYSLYTLIAGQHPSFWHWLVPGFFSLPQSA